MRILRSRDSAALAWKNGLGVSHVVASQPHGAGYDAVDWQVGTTSIEASCRFSELPGLDRQFILLEGEGVELHCRGAGGDPDLRRRIDAPLEPFAFRGDWQTECRLLGGPVRVLNVVTRRGACSARVSTATMQVPTVIEKAAGETLLVFIVAGSMQIEGCPDTLATNDAMIAEGAKPGRYSMRGTSARMVAAHLAPVRPTAGQ